ncbi:MULTISPECIES: MmgE/PrpD family protein [Halomonadaceae]|uniref:MmgE/PrpD family protein n=1 Tax=Halomonadaceae TaxID=28256 RepID=UPI0015999542|nr:MULTISPECIES: MmgE/PrpD family protein [Halomonas]QJQ96829.1 MmgE/PrpD family protein [Halomonas sp. PA5]
MPTVIETIAQWAAGRPLFNARCRELAHHAITDTLGCMIAGRDDTATQAVRRAFVGSIVADDQPGSDLIGGGRASPAVAALLNATAAHALDYDDNFRPAITHPSAVLVPALLAVAQARNASGRQLVDAYLIGLEAQALVGEGVNPSHYTLGWHATSTVGVIGSACGVAWLMGLEERGIARAMSLATSMAAGPKGQFGTLAKPLHAGLAARNAVEAAQLAVTEMSGRLDILECPQGFMELFGGSRAPGWGALREGHRRPNAPHSIESAGVLPKRHPCCGSTHQVIDAVLALKAQHGFTAQEVVAVETRVGVANARNLAYPEPDDEMQARFSMPYCVALALAQTKLSLADFTPEAIRRPELRALLPLVTMHHYSVEQEAECSTHLPHWVGIHLRDGRLLEAERHHARGSLGDPFDEQDRAAKFADCCLALPPSRGDELYRGLSQLDEQASLEWLRAAFSPPPPVATLGA